MSNIQSLPSEPIMALLNLFNNDIIQSETLRQVASQVNLIKLTM